MKISEFLHGCSETTARYARHEITLEEMKHYLDLLATCLVESCEQLELKLEVKNHDKR